MKYIFLISLTFFIACSSTKRFTSDKNGNSGENIELNIEKLELIQTGIASYYAEQYHGRKTASGEIYNMYDLTAAHPTLPFGVKLLVLNTKNDKSVIVRINDRMPDFKGRVIDLSLAAAQKIEMIKDGITEVKIYRISD